MGGTLIFLWVLAIPVTEDAGPEPTYKGKMRVPPPPGWLSSRVHDSRPMGCGFEPHRHHCVVALSKTRYCIIA